MSKNSSNKPGKSALANLLLEKRTRSSASAIVSPVLQQVGKLAAGVANVSTGSSSSMNSGSATGNPRNKCSLQPGHSLMDWIRLGSSGRDLTGVGPRAGQLSVTKHELSQHNKEYDAWLAIRGKVYNVTAYLPFHPGGIQELMKGAGIDATKLFDQIHPWVNYEQILQKCYVGRLVAFEPGADVEALFFGSRTSPTFENDSNKKPSIKTWEPPKKSPLARPQDLPNKEEPWQKEEHVPQKFTLPINSPEFRKPRIKFLEKYPPKVDPEPKEDQPDDGPVLPRFDWIQRTRWINLMFYTKSFSNPLVEVLPPDYERTLVVTLIYDDTIFTNEIVFHDKVNWPCTIHVSFETGKIELEFEKTEWKIWDDVGVLRQECKPVGTTINCCAKCNFVFSEKKQVTHNTFLVRLERTDGARVVVPIGRHVRAFGNVEGQEMSRSYTPIPKTFFTQFATQGPITDCLCLMIKRYENGNVSRFLTNSEQNDVIHITKPIGDFDLQLLRKRETYLLLAAGTGITPMLSIIQFLLERRVKKCQFARLLFFNRREEDIPFREQFQNFVEIDDRLRVTYILSEPSKDWTGLTGHVNKEKIDNAIQEHIRDTGYTIANIFTFICGPNPFVALSIEELHQVGLTDEQIYAFQG
ncbi:cytochrome b5 reductase 4 [Anoplophora glabripennis]|uniref:cytochrome b5 reductase 4 n=1 Tax=Anoplophora glabripennis TaxID=217634 RepID=UPI000875988D|nr:cytochrome b5 reductase 4 [Anoplophora glabripennis]